jgi:hypothetical protein
MHISKINTKYPLGCLYSFTLLRRLASGGTNALHELPEKQKLHKHKGHSLMKMTRSIIPRILPLEVKVQRSLAWKLRRYQGKFL